MGIRFFLTNLIACLTRSTCKKVSFELSPPLLVTNENNRNVLTTISTSKAGISMYKAHLPFQPTTEIYSPLCLHSYGRYTTSSCEACIRQRSETGDMRKYYIQHREQRYVMYIINTSDPSRRAIVPHAGKFVKGSQLYSQQN